MVSVWFNNYGFQQALLLSFAYLLQFSCFVLYTLALTLTIEDALNKLQELETRLKTVLGKYKSTSFTWVSFFYRKKYHGESDIDEPY